MHPKPHIVLSINVSSVGFSNIATDQLYKFQGCTAYRYFNCVVYLPERPQVIPGFTKIPPYFE